MQILNNLVYNYIDDLAKKPDQGDVTEKLVLKILKHQKSHLFQTFDFDTTTSFRNFLFRIINSKVSSFQPLSDGENMLMVYDIIMYIQFIDQERQKTLPEEIDEDNDDERELRMELEEAGQKLNEHFYSKDVSRVDIFDSIMSRETGLIKHRFGVEFIVSFFDFFDYYAVANESQASFLNIHLVYENFYHFLNKLRFDLESEEENVFKFVLDNMEMCLRFTDHYDEDLSANPISKVCDFSHRKYAEMYFFYKFYLLRTQKLLPDNTQLTLSPYEGTTFNTHVRTFLSYL